LVVLQRSQHTPFLTLPFLAAYLMRFIIAGNLLGLPAITVPVSGINVSYKYMLWSIPEPDHNITTLYIFIFIYTETFCVADVSSIAVFSNRQLGNLYKKTYYFG
jgi:hypothetical protein